MNAVARTRTLIVLALLAVAPASVPVPAGAGDAEASYVRVCRNDRGVADRRACHRTDAGRTVLALNF